MSDSLVAGHDERLENGFDPAAPVHDDLGYRSLLRYTLVVHPRPARGGP